MVELLHDNVPAVQITVTKLFGESPEKRNNTGYTSVNAIVARTLLLLFTDVLN